MRAPSAGAWAATLASTSSASSPAGTTTTTPSARSTTTAEVELRLERLGLGRPGGPCTSATAPCALLRPRSSNPTTTTSAQTRSTAATSWESSPAPPTPAAPSSAEAAARRGVERPVQQGVAVDGEERARGHRDQPRHDAPRLLEARGVRDTWPTAGQQARRRPPTRWRRTPRLQRADRATGDHRLRLGLGFFGLRPWPPSAVGLVVALGPVDGLGDLVLDQLDVRVAGVDQRRHQGERRDLLAPGLERQVDERGRPRWPGCSWTPSPSSPSRSRRSCVSTVCGLIWWSIAVITHFCRAIRE